MKKTSPIWHPMTQHAVAGPEIFVDRAEGATLYGRGGRAIIDAISSWWVITHGHCHPKIVEAVKAQAGRLDQVIFAGFTHQPAEKLAEKLLAMAGFDHVFFSDSGSTAVEVALKMAIGHFANMGRPRRRIVALEGGYHGDTFGAMSAGARGVFNRPYEPFLFDVHHLPFPQREGLNTIVAFEDFLKRNDGEVAALILEPLVLGAGGMKIYVPAVLARLADLCERHGVLLIADEVMTGFGRTGTRFACEQAGIKPDILCLSKGLTGGFLPMGATLCTRRIYNSFYDTDRSKTFFHSSSFTGNALACAAALANLEIWEEEPVMERVQAVSQAHIRAAQWFGARPDIVNVRSLGTIFALDLRAEDAGYLAAIGPTLYKFYLEKNVLLRPLGNTVYILPPYCITQEELDRIYDTVWRSLDFIRDEGTERAA